MRITGEAHEAAMAAPLGAMTLIERFSLLVKRGVMQPQDCHRHYVLGVIDMQDALIKAGVSKDIATAAANKLISEYR